MKGRTVPPRTTRLEFQPTANGIARIEGALGGTTDRVKELDATVNSNAERITALEVVGTPD